MLYPVLLFHLFRINAALSRRPHSTWGCYVTTQLCPVAVTCTLGFFWSLDGNAIPSGSAAVAGEVLFMTTVETAMK